MHRLGRLLDRFLEQVLSTARWLVLPISLLLFLQWPLRDAVQAYSREANDTGQWLFALYIAVSVTAATRAGTHLAVDTFARRYSQRARRMLSRACDLFVLTPWAVFVAVSAGPAILSSISHWERFPDTGNPGYLIIKLALWLMAGLILLAVAVGLLGGDAGRKR